MGVDILENCEVTGIRRDSNGAVSALETTRGVIESRKIGVSAAGNTSVVMKMAGVKLPLESYPAAGTGLRAHQADFPLRGDVEHGPRLYQPVR